MPKRVQAPPPSAQPSASRKTLADMLTTLSDGDRATVEAARKVLQAGKPGWRAAVTQALADLPENPVTIFYRGMALEDDDPRKFELYQRCIDLEPNWERPIQKLALLYVSKARSTPGSAGTKAMKLGKPLAKRVYELDPANAVNCWLMYAIQGEQQFSAQLKYLREALAIDPNYRRALADALEPAGEVGTKKKGEPSEYQVYAARLEALREAEGQ